MGWRRNILGLGAGLMGFLAVSASSAQANTKRCDFTSWRGALHPDIAQSWVGMGFEVDESAGRLRVVHATGTSGWFAVTARQSSRFTTFARFMQARSTSGQQYNNRYGFRVYADGRCETLMEDGVHVPIVGRGTIK